MPLGSHKLKLALIGLGRRGRGAHLPLYPKLSHVYDFVAVCDKDEEALHEVGESYGVHTYTSVRCRIEPRRGDAAATGQQSHNDGLV